MPPANPPSVFAAQGRATQGCLQWNSRLCFLIRANAQDGGALPPRNDSRNSKICIPTCFTSLSTSTRLRLMRCLTISTAPKRSSIPAIAKPHNQVRSGDGRQHPLTRSSRRKTRRRGARRVASTVRVCPGRVQPRVGIPASAGFLAASRLKPGLQRNGRLPLWDSH